MKPIALALILELHVDPDHHADQARIDALAELDALLSTFRHASLIEDGVQIFVKRLRLAKRQPADYSDG